MLGFPIFQSSNVENVREKRKRKAVSFLESKSNKLASFLLTKKKYEKFCSNVQLFLAHFSLYSPSLSTLFRDFSIRISTIHSNFQWRKISRLLRFVPFLHCFALNDFVMLAQSRSHANTRRLTSNIGTQIAISFQSVFRRRKRNTIDAKVSSRVQ